MLLTNHGKDCLDYARRCDSCQFHANFIYKPPEVLHPTITSWSFDAWGLDNVGALPESSGVHLYILDTIDYFSKWVKVVAFKEVKKDKVANFIRVIIYCFGIPCYIITYNGNPFDKKLLNKICDLFGFKHRKSSMYHTAANGLVNFMRISYISRPKYCTQLSHLGRLMLGDLILWEHYKNLLLYICTSWTQLITSQNLFE